MKTLIIINILFFTLVFYVSPIYSQSKTIKGQIVSDEKSKPISKAKVSLLVSDFCTDSTFTDKKGNFIFESESTVDTFNLRIDKKKYASTIYEGIVIKEIDTDLGTIKLLEYIDIGPTRCVWK